MIDDATFNTVINDYFETKSNEVFDDDMVLTIQDVNGTPRYNYWNADVLIAIMYYDEYYARLALIEDDKVRAAILATYVTFLLTENKAPNVCRDSDVIPYNGGYIADCKYEDIEIKVFCRSHGEVTGEFKKIIEYSKDLCKTLSHTADALRDLATIVKEDTDES